MIVTLLPDPLISLTAIGKTREYAKFLDEYDSAIVAVGNCDFRLNLIKELIEAGYEVPALIHTRAYVAPSAKVGMGSFVEPMAVVNTDVTVKNGCIISAGAIINHNSVIEDGCHINCGSVVKSGVLVAARTRSDYCDLFDNDYHDFNVKNLTVFSLIFFIQFRFLSQNNHTGGI